MHPLSYHRASSVRDAVAESSEPGAALIAGGTSVVDLLKEGSIGPTRLVDISRLPLDGIRSTDDGGMHVGALVSNTALAEHPVIARRYTAVSEAVHSGATQQIRGMASTAGNLLQRTRCPYFRDPDQACNKREPGSGCAAVHGFNRMHAIFGHGYDESVGVGPTTCIAAHPSDLAVALVAFDAGVLVEGPDGRRTIAVHDLLRLPDGHPDADFTLRPGEVITELVLPPFMGRSHYLKVRDRASFAYALVSCAATVEMDDAGRITRARVALGSVAARPWRLPAVEQLLVGERPSAELAADAAALASHGSIAFSMNGYKRAFSRSIVRRILLQTTALDPLPGPPGTALAASVGGLAGTSRPRDELMGGRS
jgi:xanthine dehydrogenase YagS FAD-binding subunit